MYGWKNYSNLCLTEFANFVVNGAGIFFWKFAIAKERNIILRNDDLVGNKSRINILW